MAHPVLDKKRTRTADILLVRPGWVEQRYLKDAQFTDETVLENRDVIERMGTGAPYVLLNVFPAGMRVNAPLMDQDYYRDLRGSSHMCALAVVTDSEEMYAAANLYFFFHRQAFDVKVFEEENDARAWLEARMPR